MDLEKLLASINAKVQEVKDLVAKNDVDGAKTAKQELQELQDKYDLLKDLDDEAKDGITNKIINGTATPAGGSKDSTKEFANAAKNGFRNSVTPNKEGTDANGGYVVPDDIQTKINKYRDVEFSLLGLIDSEPVTTEKGARTFQKKAQQTGFTQVGEGGKIGGKAGPQFERITYEIKKYAGYFPVTNELLSDSDSNITNVIVEWIGGEARATANAQILAKIKTKSATELVNIDGIQKAIIVTLGAAYAGTSKIVTNDDGLLYLSTLKDSNGNYLLKQSNNDPMKKVLAVGAMSVPLEVIGNAVLASDITTASKRGIPFIIGDLKEGIKKFDRQQTSIMASNSAAVTDFNAFEEDMTLFRAIEREDYVIKDAAAFVNGKITIDDTTVMGE